jgi:hypothetical protein
MQMIRPDLPEAEKMLADFAAREGGALRGDGVPTKGDDWGDKQERLTRAIISELRDDLGDLLRGLDAGT